MGKHQISIRNNQTRNKMKLALATLALAAANDDDRAFVNVDGFMSADPPSWWTKHPAEKRLKWLGNNNVKFFETHFPEEHRKLQPLFEDYIQDMQRIEAACQPGRRRRDEESSSNSSDQEEEEDFMDATDLTRKVTGDIVKDADRYTKNLARWAKFQIYDKGGKCEFLGLRLLNRADRLRWYVHYRYCDKVDDSVSFCDKYYWTENGYVRKDPRDDTHWIQNAFQKPTRN